MAETMKAAVLHAVDDLRIDEVPVPKITPERNVLVRIVSVGVCGSDVHWWKRGYIGPNRLESPTIMGHEAAGEVVEVYGDARGLQPGDRVAIEPGYTCRKCEFCRSGHYNMCPDVVFLAAPPVDGAFCEYITWPADFLFPLPDNMSMDEGAMLEPLSVGLHAARRSGVRAGDSVAIFGAGAIGLCALQSARAHGATTIIAADLVPLRLELAEKLGATEVLDAGAVDVEDAIMDLTQGRGVDVAIECAGTVPTIQTAMRVTRSAGKVQLVGMPAETDPQIPLYQLINRELDVSGLFRYAGCYPPAIELVSSGRVDVASLITHHFPLEQTVEAMQFAHENKDKAVKVVVTTDKG